jgi:hypothetical protein
MLSVTFDNADSNLMIISAAISSRCGNHENREWTAIKAPIFYNLNKPMSEHSPAWFRPATASAAFLYGGPLDFCRT